MSLLTSYSGSLTKRTGVPTSTSANKAAISSGYISMSKGTVSVINRRIIAWIDYADDVAASRRGALHGVLQLAGQEQDISRGDGGLGVLGPHHARAAEENQRLFVQMPVRLGLR